MKGTLQKTDRGWQVTYEVLNSSRTLPLHPKYEKYYFLDEDAHGGTVEFEIVTDYTDSHTNQVQKYAKLERPKEQTNGERFEEFMDTIKSNENFKQYSIYEHKETVTSSDTPTYGKGELVYKDGTPIRSYYSAKIQALLDEVIAEEATRPFILFVDDIDTELALIEDYAKGEVGEAITKLRKKIAHFYTTLK